jgi:hypothetical protein
LQSTGITIMAKARKRKAKSSKRKKTSATARRTKRAARNPARKSVKRRKSATGRNAPTRKTSRRKTGRAAPAGRKTKRKAARGAGRRRRSASTPTRAEELRRADMPDPDNPAEAAEDLHTPDPVHTEDGGVAEHPIHDSDTEDMRSADYERMIEERARGGYDTSDKYEMERDAGRKMRKPGKV